MENEKYFAARCLYIHGNALWAKIVKDLFKYRWSNYRGYMNKRYRGKPKTSREASGQASSPESGY
jgi:hypothetical protein